MFQKKVNINPALGVPGEFASNNPFFSLVAGEGQLVAGEKGVQVGTFGFADLATGKVSNEYAEGTRVGFVIRNYNALITEFGAESSMTVQPGREVTLISSGDVFALCEDAKVGQHVVALKKDGTLKAVDDIASLTDEVATGFVIGEVSADNLVKITRMG